MQNGRDKTIKKYFWDILRKHNDRKEWVSKVDIRSLIIFGWFVPIDVFLFGTSLYTELWWLIAIRMVAAMIAVYLAQPFWRGQVWSSRQSMISLTLLLLPGFGGAIGMVWSAIPSRPHGAWEDVPITPETYRSKVDCNELIHTVPLIDVLIDGEDSQKKQVLLDTDGKINVSIIRQGLIDQDREVQYYAASLINRAETVHMTEISDLERRLLTDRNNTDAWNRLAEKYRELIDEGVAGQDLSRFYQKKRLNALDRSLSVNPNQLNICIHRAEVLLALGRWEQVIQEAQSLLLSTERDRALGVLLALAYDQNDQWEIERLSSLVNNPEVLRPDVRGFVELYRERREEARA